MKSGDEITVYQIRTLQGNDLYVTSGIGWWKGTVVAAFRLKMKIATRRDSLVEFVHQSKRFNDLGRKARR